SAVDVESREALGSIVIIGGSLTDGVSLPVDDYGNGLTDQLARYLANNDKPIGVLNQGSANNFLRLNGLLPRQPYYPFGPSVRTRLKRDALEQTGVRWVIGSDSPMHELASPNLRTSGELLIEALQQVIDQAHEAGVSFLCMTIPPFEGHPTWSIEGEQYRAEYNAFVRSTGSRCDGILDVDAALLDPADPLRLFADYDSGDHWLPNSRGIQQIAFSLDLDLLQ
ncbi:MAG: hypothetical protein ABIQ16_13185, partial [Polyangiaceae bacterium]